MLSLLLLFLYQIVILQKKKEHMSIYGHFVYDNIYLYIFLHEKFFSKI